MLTVEIGSSVFNLGFSHLFPGPAPVWFCHCLLMLHWSWQSIRVSFYWTTGSILHFWVFLNCSLTIKRTIKRRHSTRKRMYCLKRTLTLETFFSLFNVLLQVVVSGLISVNSNDNVYDYAFFHVGKLRIGKLNCDFLKIIQLTSE